MQRAIIRWQRPGSILVIVILLLLLIGSARAAEFVDGNDVYRLEAGQVVSDDLYLAAGEIIIDGTIEGDLLAASGYVEINGTVTGDVMAAGAAVVITGTVEDDVRVSGAGIDISGTIGGDLIVSGGGGGFAFPIGERMVTQGVRIASSARIDGDVAAFGGQGMLDGTIGGDLFVGMGEVTLAARVAGDARLEAGSIEVRDTARVEGNLRYSSNAQVPALEGVATNVEYTPRETTQERPNPAVQVLGWMTRTVLIIAGFALLGGLLLRVAPDMLERPSQALAQKPGQALLYGLLVAVIFILLPIASAILVFLMVFFWGILPGIVLGVFLFVALTLIWIFSPLVTGFWLGKWLVGATGRNMAVWPTLVVGIILLVLLGRVPFLGYFIYLVSFLFALGGLWLSRRSGEVAVS